MLHEQKHHEQISWSCYGDLGYATPSKASEQHLGAGWTVMNPLRKIVRRCIPLLLLALSAAVSAHDVVLKDGSTIHFDKYRVADGSLFYTTADGKELKIALNDIDLERTRQVSAADNPPLDLPGLRTQPPVPPPNSDTSLGDIARKLRAQNSTAKTQRTFTDDDVAHSTVSPAGNLSAASPQELQVRIRSLQNRLSELGDKTARQLSDEVVKDIKFPGRDVWEQQLFDQKQKCVSAARTALDVAQKAMNAGTPEEREADRITAEKLLNNVDSEWAAYNRLVADGVKKATEWENKNH